MKDGAMPALRNKGNKKESEDAPKLGSKRGRPDSGPRTRGSSRPSAPKTRGTSKRPKF